VFLCIGGCDSVSFLLFFIGFQIELSSLLRLETYALNDSFRNSCSLDFNLLLICITSTHILYAQ